MISGNKNIKVKYYKNTKDIFITLNKFLSNLNHKNSSDT